MQKAQPKRHKNRAHRAECPRFVADLPDEAHKQTEVWVGKSDGNAEDVNGKNGAQDACQATNNRKKIAFCDTKS